MPTEAVMKKLILILALVIMVSLAGCSGFSPLFGYYGPRYDYLAKPGPRPAVTLDKQMTAVPK